MSILRGYKSIAFILIFTTLASLGAGGCKEWWKDFCRYFSNRNKENNIGENPEKRMRILSTLRTSL